MEMRVTDFLPPVNKGRKVVRVVVEGGRPSSQPRLKFLPYAVVIPGMEGKKKRKKKSLRTCLHPKLVHLPSTRSF